MKIARATTGRPAIIAFYRGFHGRTLMTMTLTSKVMPYKKGFGPFAPEVYRVPAPYPYRGITTDDSIAALEQLFLAHVDPRRSPARARAGPGRGRLHPDAAGLPAAAARAVRHARDPVVDDEVQSGVGRTGPVWAIEHYDAQPDLLVSGKSLGGGLPLAAVTGPRRAHGRRRPGRSRRHVRRQPGVLRGGHRRARHGARPRHSSRRARRWRPLALELTMATARPRSATCAGSARCSRSSSSATRRARRPSSSLRARGRARRGLLLLSCGLHGNVIRLLPPLTIGDADLAAGLDALEAALRQAVG